MPHELGGCHDPQAAARLLGEMPKIPRHQGNPFDEGALRAGSIVRVRELHHFIGPNLRPSRTSSNRRKHIAHVRWLQTQGGADRHLGVFRKPSFLHDRDDGAGT
jgi:hypothetical protein